MKTLLRILLVFVALYLVFRYIFRIFSPDKREDKVQGAPRKRRGRFDEERISDANFKDITDKK